MGYRVDDWVVHPQHGVGRVVKLEVRQFGPGTKQRYYEISIPTGTIWVPVDGPPNALRRLTSKGELGRYRGLLRSRPTALASDHRQRQLALVERLRESSLQARCEVVRDLTAHSWLKPLNESSGTLLRNARQVLCAEWAAAEGLSLAEAAHEIEALLVEGRKLHEKQGLGAASAAAGARSASSAIRRH